MEYRVICAGFGGQGVLSLGKFVVYAAMDKGLNVTWLPSYGPEMRGGTANCSLVLSDDEVASPLVSVPDCVIAMNRPSLDKFVNDVAPNGLIIVNSSLIDVKVERKDVRTYYVKANDISAQFGDNRSANIVMLGAFAKLCGVVGKTDVEKFLIKQFGAKAPKLLDIFNAGYGAV